MTIHQDGVIEVDGIVRKSEAYREEEFSRRRQIRIADFQTSIVSLEDLILSKLYWARESHSELQLRDVRNSLPRDCDTDYLRSRAKILGGSNMFDAGRTIILSSFSPGTSQLEITRQLCERLYGDEVDVAAFVQSLTKM